MIYYVPLRCLSPDYYSKTKFGPWRTLSDAVARGTNSTTTTTRQQQQQQKEKDSTLVGPQPHCTPMQQGMDPYLESSLRPCYDKMRDDYVFGEPLRQVRAPLYRGWRV